MKVMIVSRGYPSEMYPMNGIFEMDQAKALSTSGVDVIFLAIDIRSIRRKRRFGFNTFHLGHIKVYAIDIPIGKIPPGLESFILRKLFKYLYKKVVLDIGIPDIIHAHFPKMGDAIDYVKVDKCTPIIITEHSSGFIENPIPTRLITKAMKSYRNADFIITVSPYLQAILKNDFNIESKVIPNVVDTSLFNYNPVANKTNFTFITIGNFIYRKRMDLTLKAFHHVSEKYPNTKLIMVGDGPEMSGIVQYIDTHKLHDSVDLTGRLGREKMIPLLQKSDAFVLASRAETFGVVYIEALASGLPVIATKCKGPEGFISKDNGIIVDIDDLEALTAAMLEMLTTIHQYDHKLISKKAKDSFSPEIIASLLITLYKHAIEEFNEKGN